MREWDQIIVHKLSTSAKKSYTLVIKALQQQKKEMGTENQVWVIKKKWIIEVHIIELWL